MRSGAQAARPCPAGPGVPPPPPPAPRPHLAQQPLHLAHDGRDHARLRAQHELQPLRVRCGQSLAQLRGGRRQADRRAGCRVGVGYWVCTWPPAPSPVLIHLPPIPPYTRARMCPPPQFPSLAPPPPPPRLRPLAACPPSPSRCRTLSAMKSRMLEVEPTTPMPRERLACRRGEGAGEGCISSYNGGGRGEAGAWRGQQAGTRIRTHITTHW